MSQNSPVVPSRPRAKADVHSSTNVPVVPSRPRKVKSEDSESSSEKVSEASKTDQNDHVERILDNARVESASLSPQENLGSRVSAEDTKKEGEVSGKTLSAIVSEMYDSSSSPEPRDDEFEVSPRKPAAVEDTVNISSGIEDSTDLVLEQRTISGAASLDEETKKNGPISPGELSEDAQSITPEVNKTYPKSADPLANVSENVPSIPTRPKRSEKSRTVSGDVTPVEVSTASHARDASKSAVSQTESLEELVDSAKSAVLSSKHVTDNEDRSEVIAESLPEAVGPNVHGKTSPNTQCSEDVGKIEEVATPKTSSPSEPSLSEGTVDSVIKDTGPSETPTESPNVGLPSETTVPQPFIPKRPSRTNTPKIPGRPVKPKSADSAASVVKITDGSQIPASEIDPETKSDAESGANPETTSGDKADTKAPESGTKKAPPPKPKKLSSKIAAFQQMFNQAPLQHTAPAPVPRKYGGERGKLSSERTDFASNLQNMMGAGIALPGMANPEMLKKLAPAVESEEPEEAASGIEDVTAETGSSTPSIPRRARGPRGKKLPKSIQEAKIEVKPRFQILVSEVWKVDLRSKNAEGGVQEDAEGTTSDDKLIPTAESVQASEIVSSDVAVDETEDETEDGSRKPVASKMIDTADTENGLGVKEKVVSQVEETKQTNDTHAETLEPKDKPRGGSKSEVNAATKSTSDDTHISKTLEVETSEIPSESIYVSASVVTEKTQSTASLDKHTEPLKEVGKKTSVSNFPANTEKTDRSEMPAILDPASAQGTQGQVEVNPSEELVKPKSSEETTPIPSADTHEVKDESIV